MTEKQDRLQIASAAGGTDIARCAIADPVTCGTYVGRNGTMWDTRRAAVPQLSHRRPIHSHTFSHIRRPRSHVRAERDPERRPSGERQRSGKKGQRMERSGVAERVETADRQMSQMLFPGSDGSAPLGERIPTTLQLSFRMP